MLVLPNVITKKLYPGGEIVQRRLVGCRGFSLPTCNHIEFGNLDLFTLRLNQNRSSIQLIYDLEYLLVELARGRLGEEYPANSEVHRCALALRNERIGRLLDSVLATFPRQARCLSTWRVGERRRESFWTTRSTTLSV